MGYDKLINIAYNELLNAKLSYLTVSLSAFIDLGNCMQSNICLIILSKVVILKHIEFIKCDK